MKYTGNYNLKKPEGTDVVNIEDLNDNADIIDQALKAHNDALDAHKAEKATQEQLGHVKAGQNITIDADGTINAKGGDVNSVNGKTGDVVIDVPDIAGLNRYELALGRNASATGEDAIALGWSASATDEDAIAIGDSASAGYSAIAMGRNASATWSESIAIGDDASVSGYVSIALGQNASAGGNYTIAIGQNASVTLFDGIALGRNASAGGSYAIAMGRNASAAESASIAIGWSTSATEDDAIALGWSASATGYVSIALGRNASAENDNEGILGGTGTSSTSKWKVPGSFTVSGTKNFEIPHPKPEKKATHVIRHGAVESPTPGDTLYRWRVQASKDNDLVTINLPDYFVWLNKDVQIFVTPQGHFGNGYGELNREKEQLEIHCQYEGEYNVLVIGTRNDDHPSVQEWYIKGVEREIGESWTGETYVFSVDEIMEVEEIKEVL